MQCQRAQSLTALLATMPGSQLFPGKLQGVVDAVVFGRQHPGAQAGQLFFQRWNACCLRQTQYGLRWRGLSIEGAYLQAVSTGDTFPGDAANRIADFIMAEDIQAQ